MKTHILSRWGQHRPICGARGNVKGALPDEATCQRCNPPGPRKITLTYRSGRKETYEIDR